MSDEAVAAPIKRRAGRPKKVRHDPVDAPVDGNQSCDRVDNKEPGFVYLAASDDDIPTILGRGGVVCQRDTEQARPFFDVRRDAGEAHFNIKGLTLMKIRQDLYDRSQGQGLSIAQQRLTALRKNATSQLGNGQFAAVTNHEYNRSVQ